MREREYVRSVVTEALGWRELSNVPSSLLGPLWGHLTAQHQPAGEGRTTENRGDAELWEGFATAEQTGPRGENGPWLSLARWPGGAPFALFLSHDIDQVLDRELFRVLADLNHIRRVLLHGETGNVRLGVRRVVRALLRPKPASRDFRTILEMEGRHGFRSTFYVLHDPYWSRMGPRYTLRSPDLHEIVRLIQRAGGEIGVHGGYYRFNNAQGYEESLVAVRETFGTEAVGIRNHHLRFSYPETWRAQAQAGFRYDATYGWNHLLGARSGLPFPFPAYDSVERRPSDLIELPLTVMDTTLFRHLGLQGETALEAAWSASARVIGVGGLVTLLWHNNFFNEPEYWDWQWVYEALLERLARRKPWCATGAEIQSWWRRRQTIQWAPPQRKSGVSSWTVVAPEGVEDLVLLVRPVDRIAALRVIDVPAEIERRDGAWWIRIQRLPGGASVGVEARA